MDNAALVINFAPAPEQTDADKPCRFVNLEQAKLPRDAANLADVNAMMLMAASGLSATSYRQDDCPLRVIDDTIIEFGLGFYVFPAPLDLPYALSTAIGTIDQGKRIEQDRSLEVVAEMSRTVELDGVYTGNVQARTPAINSDGSIIANSYQLDGCRIVQGREAFRVFWLTGKRHGYEHMLTIRVEDVGKNKIINLQPKVIVNWLDTDGKSQAKSLDLEVPQCILDAISTCPDEVTGDLGHVVRKAAQVYYSTCDGSVLGVRYHDSEQS